MSVVEGLILFFSIVAAVCSFLVFYKLYFIDQGIKLSSLFKRRKVSVKPQVTKKMFINPALGQIVKLITTEVEAIQKNKGDATIIQYWNQVYSLLAERISHEKKPIMTTAAEFLGLIIYSEIVKPLTIDSFMANYAKLGKKTKTIDVESELQELIKSESIESFIYQVTEEETSLQKDFTIEGMKDFSWANQNLHAHTLSVIKKACEVAHKKSVANVDTTKAENIKLATIHFILDITQIMEHSKELGRRLEILNQISLT